MPDGRTVQAIAVTDELDTFLADWLTDPAAARAWFRAACADPGPLCINGREYARRQRARRRRR